MLELTTLMDAHYGVGQWTGRTGVGLGTDIGPALNAGFTQLRANGGRGKIHIPAGEWLLTTSPMAALLSGNYLEGDGSQASVIVYNQASGAALTWSGAGGFTAGGMRGISLMLESGFGDSNAIGILLQGDATYQPDQTEWEDIYMSSIGALSFWYNGFEAYGNARTAPQGIRVANITNLQIFNCRNVAMYLSNVVQWTLANVGSYTGKGGGNDIYITGGGSGLINSTHVDARLLNCGGTLHVSNTLDCVVNGIRYS